MGAVPQAVPSAVAPSAKNTVIIRSRPNKGPHAPMTGSSVIPVIPASGDPSQVSPQPAFGGSPAGTGTPLGAGGEAAPTVPALGGPAFRSPPIDSHYTSTAQAANPYAKVNNPPTRGMLTFVLRYLNGIALGSQDRENTGWNNRSPQQRTSVMRVTPPPHGAGFTQQTYTPRANPQSPNTAKYLPSTGTVSYGGGGARRYTRGVLNSDALGAGQTAGGQGGSNYTPLPGPPDTDSVTPVSIPQPTWG